MFINSELFFNYIFTVCVHIVNYLGLNRLDETSFFILTIYLLPSKSALFLKLG